MIEAIISTATLLLDFVLIGSLAVFAGKKLGYESGYISKVEDFISENVTEVVFVVATVATLGSLYFSNVLGYTPCRLCWFQRIFMYPIAVISGTALFLDRSDIKDYVLPLAMIGAPIALYHAIIQRIEQFSSAGCSVTAVSCSTEYTFHYGYITIPVMALTAFLVIIVVLWRFRD
ncbi:disulfide bond formation protein B [Nanohaloarchaea archaeon H01]|nr:disulfide bond formation protein B [Nanohaloarchaea archaeon H01]